MHNTSARNTTMICCCHCEFCQWFWRCSNSGVLHEHFACPSFECDFLWKKNEWNDM